jgi:hypothetical protein
MAMNPPIGRSAATGDHVVIGFLDLHGPLAPLAYPATAPDGGALRWRF